MKSSDPLTRLAPVLVLGASLCLTPLLLQPAAAGVRAEPPYRMAQANSQTSASDSSSGPLEFTPKGDEPEQYDVPEEWLCAPFGERLLSDPDVWRARRGWEWTRHHNAESRFHLAYNRVDRVRIGTSLEIQDPETLNPRVGARVDYTTDRKRWLYGVQFEQPLAPPGRVSLGVSMARRTDQYDLQQVEDVENSLALLFGRNDYRDYFEREGFGAYLSWRVPDFSTISAHIRNDDYRSLEAIATTRSWFHRDRALRPNPAIDEGRTHTAVVRLERIAHHSYRTRAGLYHWIEMEWAGQGLGGDFNYTRALADVRSVIRLTPVSTLALRLVGGHTLHGSLPAQKQFTAGGVDGLRAQPFARFRGDQIALGQAEYQVELGRIAKRGRRGGLHAIVFMDVGRAWTSTGNDYDLDRQRLQTDAGFGVAASDNKLRVYFARDLRKRDADFLVSMRLQRPF